MEKEELINKIIEIDKKAREQINKEKDKSFNMQKYVGEEFEQRKKEIDEAYKSKLEAEKKKYADMFMQEKKKIDEELKKELDEITKNYKENEQRIINENFEKIKAGEEWCLTT